MRVKLFHFYFFKKRLEKYCMNDFFQMRHKTPWHWSFLLKIDFLKGVWYLKLKGEKIILWNLQIKKDGSNTDNPRRWGKTVNSIKKVVTLFYGFSLDYFLFILLSENIPKTNFQSGSNSTAFDLVKNLKTWWYRFFVNEIWILRISLDALQK